MPVKTKAALEEENDALRFELAAVAEALGEVKSLNKRLSIFAEQIKDQREILFAAIKLHFDTLQHPTIVDSRLYGAVVEVADRIAKRRKRCERVCSAVDGKCHGQCVLEDGCDEPRDSEPRDSDECWPHG